MVLRIVGIMTHDHTSSHSTSPELQYFTSSCNVINSAGVMKIRPRAEQYLGLYIRSRLNEKSTL